jgi:hypothetical protein
MGHSILWVKRRLRARTCNQDDWVLARMMRGHIGKLMGVGEMLIFQSQWIRQ